MTNDVLCTPVSASFHAYGGAHRNVCLTALNSAKQNSATARATGHFQCSPCKSGETSSLIPYPRLSLILAYPLSSLTLFLASPCFPLLLSLK
jgi:hypothetical protein